MSDFPNAVDMIFGRIDRNTDTQYRDKNLAQQQAQFVDQLALDKEKTRLAHEQFMKNFGMQEGQMKFQQGQQGFTNNLAVNEAVAKGIFRPVATPQQQGVMSGNMFMQNPAAIPSVNNGDPTMGPGFEFNGQRLQPVNQRDLNLKTLLDQKQVERKFKDEDEQYQIKQLTSILKVNPLTARMMVNYPQMFAHIVGSGNIVGFLKLMGNGAVSDEQVKAVIEGMGSLTATQAEAGLTNSQRAVNNAQIGNLNSMAGLHGAQANALTLSKEGEGIYNEAATAAFKQGINASDPRYIGAIRSYIDALPIDQKLKNEAASVITRDTTPRTLGQNLFSQFGIDQSGKNLDTQSRPIVQPVPATVTSTSGSTNSRQSGEAPAQVNIKPPSVTGPPGALQYTQPNQSPIPPMQFIPNGINEVGPASMIPNSPRELLQYHPLAYPVNKFTDMMNRWKQRQDERRYN